MFLYCLAVAAKRFGIIVHAYVVLSNHYHLDLTDPKGLLPQFVHWLDLHVARALNSFHERSDHFWDCRPPSYVRLGTHEDVLRKIAYTLTNPVAAGLVARGSDWPGLRSRPDQYGRTLEVKRPEFFFSGDEKSATPPVAQLELEVPECYAHLPAGEFQRRLEEKVREEEGESRARLKAEGRTVLGRIGVLEQSPFATPSSSDGEGRGELSPQVACSDTWLRIEMLKRLVEFAREYAEALKHYIAGEREVEFPAGTFLMKQRFKVRCRPSPSAAIPRAPP